MIRWALLPLAVLTVALAACSSGDDSTADAPSAGTPATPTAPTAPTAEAAPTTSASLPVDAVPTTPRGAVEAFLVAEVRGDTTASYALLSAPDQMSYSTNEWIHAQADLPRYLGFAVRADQPLVDGSGTEVLVDAVLRSQLDEIVGLVPAHATATWTAVPEGDQWRVDLGRSRFTAVLPPDADATTAVATWAQARQQCQAAPAEYRSLVGSPSLADALCGARGAVQTGPPRTLDQLPDSTPVLNAFGAEAATWARVVSVEGPKKLDVVVAPVNDQWLVIGVTALRK
jgi:hypothetical protein